MADKKCLADYGYLLVGKRRFLYVFQNGLCRFKQRNARNHAEFIKNYHLLISWADRMLVKEQQQEHLNFSASQLLTE